MSALLQNLKDNPAFAGGGTDFISSTDNEKKGAYFGLYVVTDTVLQSISFNSRTSGAARIVGITLPAGTFIPAGITAVRVTSGVIGLFNA